MRRSVVQVDIILNGIESLDHRPSYLAYAKVTGILGKPHREKLTTHFIDFTNTPLNLMIKVSFERSQLGKSNNGLRN